MSLVYDFCMSAQSVVINTFIKTNFSISLLCKEMYAAKKCSGTNILSHFFMNFFEKSKIQLLLLVSRNIRYSLFSDITHLTVVENVLARLDWKN